MKEGGYLRAFIKDVYAPLLTIAPVKLLVLLLTIMFFATGCAGIARIKEVPHTLPCHTPSKKLSF